MSSRYGAIAVLSVILAAVPWQAGRCESSVVVDVMPASIHANFSADEFFVTGPNGKETVSIFSPCPSLLVGMSKETVTGYLDAKAGVGMLLNSRFRAFSAQGVLAWFREVRPSVLFGPHVSLAYYFSPEWWGDTDIEFDSSLGWGVGIHVAAGDRITYLMSVDYVSSAFKITHLGEGVSANRDKLDLSGIAVQFGVRVEL